MLQKLILRQKGRFFPGGCSKPPELVYRWYFINLNMVIIERQINWFLGPSEHLSRFARHWRACVRACGGGGGVRRAYLYWPAAE